MKRKKAMKISTLALIYSTLIGCGIIFISYPNHPYAIGISIGFIGITLILAGLVYIINKRNDIYEWAIKRYIQKGGQ